MPIYDRFTRRRTWLRGIGISYIVTGVIAIGYLSARAAGLGPAVSGVTIGYMVIPILLATLFSVSVGLNYATRSWRLAPLTTDSWRFLPIAPIQPAMNRALAVGETLRFGQTQRVSRILMSIVQVALAIMVVLFFMVIVTTQIIAINQPSITTTDLSLFASVLAGFTISLPSDKLVVIWEIVYTIVCIVCVSQLLHFATSRTAVSADDDGLTLDLQCIPWREIRAVVRLRPASPLPGNADIYQIITTAKILPLIANAYGSVAIQSGKWRYVPDYDANLQCLLATITSRAVTPLRVLEPDWLAPFQASTNPANTLPEWIRHLTLEDALVISPLPADQQEPAQPISAGQRRIKLIPRIAFSPRFWLTRLGGIVIVGAFAWGLGAYLLLRSPAAEIPRDLGLLTGSIGLVGGVVAWLLIAVGITTRRRTLPIMYVERGGPRPPPNGEGNTFLSWRLVLAWVRVVQAESEDDVWYILFTVTGKIIWRVPADAELAGRGVADRRRAFADRAAELHSAIAAYSGLALRKMIFPPLASANVAASLRMPCSWLVVAPPGDTRAAELTQALRQWGDRARWIDNAALVQTSLDAMTYCVALFGTRGEAEPVIASALRYRCAGHIAVTQSQSDAESSVWFVRFPITTTPELTEALVTTASADGERGPVREAERRLVPPRLPKPRSTGTLHFVYLGGLILFSIFNIFSILHQNDTLLPSVPTNYAVVNPGCDEPSGVYWFMNGTIQCTKNGTLLTEVEGSPFAALFLQTSDPQADFSQNFSVAVDVNVPLNDSTVCAGVGEEGQATGLLAFSVCSDGEWFVGQINDTGQLIRRDASGILPQLSGQHHLVVITHEATWSFVIDGQVVETETMGAVNHGFGIQLLLTLPNPTSTAVTVQFAQFHYKSLGSAGVFSTALRA